MKVQAERPSLLQKVRSMALGYKAWRSYTIGRWESGRVRGRTGLGRLTVLQGWPLCWRRKLHGSDPNHNIQRDMTDPDSELSRQFHSYTFFFLIIYLFLFLAVLGLRFCVRAFSSCGERGPLFIVVRGPLTIAASLVAEHRLQTRRLSSCGSRA